MADGTRIDRWLWSVRLAPSRTSATDACADGRVRVDDDPVKPARRVRAGDVVTFQRGRRTLVVKVVDPISRRVGAPRAVECYEDLSPPDPDRNDPFAAPADGRRERGSGRPTKRDRRRIEQLRGRRRP